jgi:hypothetical protein
MKRLAIAAVLVGIVALVAGYARAQDPPWKPAEPMLHLWEIPSPLRPQAPQGKRLRPKWLRRKSPPLTSKRR